MPLSPWERLRVKLPRFTPRRTPSLDGDEDAEAEAEPDAEAEEAEEDPRGGEAYRGAEEVRAADVEARGGRAEEPLGRWPKLDISGGGELGFSGKIRKIF